MSPTATITSITTSASVNTEQILLDGSRTSSLQHRPGRSPGYHRPAPDISPSRQHAGRTQAPACTIGEKPPHPSSPHPRAGHPRPDRRAASAALSEVAEPPYCTRTSRRRLPSGEPLHAPGRRPPSPGRRRCWRPGRCRSPRSARRRSRAGHDLPARPPSAASSWPTTFVMASPASRSSRVSPTHRIGRHLVAQARRRAWPARSRRSRRIRPALRVADDDIADARASPASRRSPHR